MVVLPVLLLSPALASRGALSALRLCAPPASGALPERVLVSAEGLDDEDTLALERELALDAHSLLHAAKLGDDEQLSLTVCDDSFIASLNAQWRGISSPTDVLSFPMEDENLLGDVVISLDTARRQARERDHTERDELRVLLVHGLLHLLGYDHALGDDECAEMAQAERTLLDRLGWVGCGLIAAAELPDPPERPAASDS